MQFEAGSRPSNHANKLVAEVVRKVIGDVEEALKDNDGEPMEARRLESLVNVLDVFGREVFSDGELAQAVDETLLNHTSRLLALSPSIVLIYLRHRSNESLCVKLWHAVLQAISSHPDPVSALQPLIEAAEKGIIPHALRPAGDELDRTVGTLLADALTEGSEAALGVIVRVLKVRGLFNYTVSISMNRHSVYFVLGFRTLRIHGVLPRPPLDGH